jgi:hypothetical protein
MKELNETTSQKLERLSFTLCRKKDERTEPNSIKQRGIRQRKQEGRPYLTARLLFSHRFSSDEVLGHFQRLSLLLSGIVVIDQSAEPFQLAELIGRKSETFIND